MKILHLMIILFVILTLNVYTQDSLGGKFLIETLNSEDGKVFANRSLVMLKVSREFELNSTNTIENDIRNSNLKFSIVRKNENFIDSPWFKVVVGTAISFGASAAYLKNKANDADDLYKKSGNRMDLDNRIKYDLYGGIALGALELNVGFLIYKFLTD